MQSKTITRNMGLLATGLALLVLFFYTAPQAAAQAKSGKDTTPAKKVKDFDQAIVEIEKAEAELQKSMKEIDFSRMESELKAAMQKMDVDMAKMKVDLQKQLKEIDKQKIQVGIDKAMEDLKPIDAEKIKEEVQAAMAKIDTEKIQAEIARVKEVDMQKIELQLQQLKPELEKSMQEAKESMQKAKVEIKAFQTFVDDLAKEGLIDKKNYKIEIKESTLLINGKEQPADVYNRHRRFLEQHKNTTINKSDTDFNIFKQ